VTTQRPAFRTAEQRKAYAAGEADWHDGLKDDDCTYDGALADWWRLGLAEADGDMEARETRFRHLFPPNPKPPRRLSLTAMESMTDAEWRAHVRTVNGGRTRTR
jgi:hypothetical protein